SGEVPGAGGSGEGRGDAGLRRAGGRRVPAADSGGEEEADWIEAGERLRPYGQGPVEVDGGSDPARVWEFLLRARGRNERGRVHAAGGWGDAVHRELSLCSVASG